VASASLIDVPPGSLVAIPPYLVHRHPGFWPEPAGFGWFGSCPAGRRSRPTTPVCVHSLGGGRRACIGASFAELETVLVLVTIAHRFRLELTAAGMPRLAA
jgi:cytochrome P450